jgi:hypothetical protein
METGIIQKLNESVLSVVGKDDLKLFEKAYQIAKAAGELKNMLNEEYMKPIMELQGNRLGFKTDKDTNGGYPVEIVKHCLIEAVLTGVQPFGNQFNIIAGNCYITKEGFGHLLKNMAGLSYDITPQLPRINADKSGAAIVMDIEWVYGGERRKKSLDIPVKMNSFMGTDAVIGKATRKARAWLFNTITGSEIADGEVGETVDGVATVVDSKTHAQNAEEKRVTDFIAKAKDKKQLQEVEPLISNDSQYQLFNQKMTELDGKV